MSTGRSERGTRFGIRVVGIALIAALPASATVGAQTAPRRWTLTPTTRIGDDSAGTDGLSLLTTISRSPTGRLIVPQIQDATIRTFDSAGRSSISIGRRGAGPGEFRTIGFVGWLKDTLVVGDLALRRISYFRENGRFLRSDADSAFGIANSEAQSSVVAITGTGHILIESHAPAARERQIIEAFLMRARGSSKVSEFYRTTVTAPTMAVPFADGRSMSVFAPIQEVPLAAVSPKGDQIVIVEVPLPRSGDGEFTIRRYSGSGELKGVKRVGFKADRVRPAAVDTMLSDLAARIATSGRQESQRTMILGRLRDAYVAPRWYPAFNKLVVGDDGSLWLREVARPNQWRVLDASGRPIGFVEARGNVAVASRDAIWVIEGQDQGEPPSIVKYRIIR